MDDNRNYNAKYIKFPVIVLGEWGSYQPQASIYVTRSIIRLNSNKQDLNLTKTR